MGLVLLIARLALAATFIVAGLAKLRDPQGSRKTLGDFGVPSALTPLLALLLPFAELVCAIALLRDNWAVAGATGVAALLAVFSAAIIGSLARGRAPNCHCFGQLSSSPVSWRTLVRNLALLALAGVVVLKAGEIPSEWPPMPSAVWIESALAAGLVFTVWLLFHMLRQNGRLLLRLETIEKKLNIDPHAAPVAGLPVGDPAPSVDFVTFAGEPMTLRKLAEAGKPVLLVFTEPGCGACETLKPELELWQREYASRVTIAAVRSGEAGKAYLVTATPSAVLVTGGKIAAPLEAGIDAIRGLVARATLPPPVKKGDAVPSLKLADLTGKTADLATLRGRRTLLLFWNPSCGFCQKMLPDVKTWERKRAEDAPELVVISSGSLEDNRQQGFRSKVLLDPYFGSNQVFGASGTPSAIVLDEEGRVASEVGVGAPAVFALAGVEGADN